VTADNQAQDGGGGRARNKQPPVPAPTAAPPVVLRNITDMELGVTLLAGADEAAMRIAREMCPQSITPAERVALYEFLQKVALHVRWPNYRGA
jgi:hypothetical protein